MRFSHRSFVAASALLAATLASAAFSQGVRIQNRLIPESSLERPDDVGVRAHTHLQIFVGPPRGGGFRTFGGLGPGGGLTPDQVRQAYNLPATGGSQIIAIVDAYDNPNALADFNKFAAQFGLPQETSTNPTASTNKVFQVVYGNGTKPGVDATGGWELEEALDIEWAHAMAPNAKIILVEAKDNSYANLMGAVDFASSYTDGNGWQVKQVSNSWGGSEFLGETSFDPHFTSTSCVYFVSAGDSGAPAQYPSASPYVVSVGGTAINTDASGNFVSETGWTSGGGGPSAYEARPAFQNGVSALVGAARGTPDIAAGGDPATGGAVYNSYPYNGVAHTWWVVGGTSWSAPMLAGIANLAGTSVGYFPSGSQDFLAGIYNNLGGANFRDIVSGNNGYAAGAGWDFVTGVGVPVGLSGLTSAGSPPPPPAAAVVTTISPSTALVGAAGFTLTVNGSGILKGATVNWNGAALTTTFVSKSQLKATVPAANLLTAGTVDVTVVNPSGAVASNAATFTVKNPVPTLTSLSPTSAKLNGAEFTLTCTGTKYVSGAQVKWVYGGVTTLLTTTYVSATKVTAVVPATLLTKTGTASVSVVNPTPGGGASGAKSFTIVK